MTRRRRPRRSGALTELPPLRILTQMAILQALFYTVAVLLMLFTALVSGRSFSFDLVLGWESVRGDTTQGWLVAFVWLLTGGLFSSIVIVLVVQRSKLVLDFALSLHFIHLLAVVLYTGSLPHNVAWWITMAISSTIAIAVGTWGCRYRELQPITFGGKSTTSATATAAAASSAPGAPGAPPQAGPSNVVGDEEQGFTRGGRRGRGRDGAGEYEMVAMKLGDGKSQI
ncbi:integral membrane protein [Grosmannia clavigera kw1407]|uniref:Integral membrane protein n=1 Tax=Grosmannia clavigera (strain kw1407 / UAMH 11150) TaxID=655863 RepID=F0XFZ2_GROCL|nr:uncharacterized protein CMQ_5447 [Grosmannia clavigera kw1407]EFX03397.1 integral membrane protein [Grosmannia clavigera kw1407]